MKSDHAAATAIWSFIRSFGNIWVVAIPATIFNNRFEELSHRIDSPELRQQLTAGHAYEYASASFVKAAPEPIRGQIIGVYTNALKLVWQISIVFSGVVFLFIFLEKQIKLRTELDTEYGLGEKQKEKSAEDGLESENEVHQSS